MRPPAKIGVPYMAKLAATPELWAAAEPDAVDEGEPLPEVREAVPEGEAELEAAASRVVPFPHCSSRANRHWYCWDELVPVALMQTLNHSQQIWAGTVCW